MVEILYWFILKKKTKKSSRSASSTRVDLLRRMNESDERDPWAVRATRWYPEWSSLFPRSHLRDEKCHKSNCSTVPSFAWSSKACCPGSSYSRGPQLASPWGLSDAFVYRSLQTDCEPWVFRWDSERVPGSCRRRSWWSRARICGLHGSWASLWWLPSSLGESIGWEESNWPKEPASSWPSPQRLKLIESKRGLVCQLVLYRHDRVGGEGMAFTRGEERGGESWRKNFKYLLVKTGCIERKLCIY